MYSQQNKDQRCIRLFFLEALVEGAIFVSESGLLQRLAPRYAKDFWPLPVLVPLCNHNVLFSGKIPLDAILLVANHFLFCRFQNSIHHVSLCDSKYLPMPNCFFFQSWITASENSYFSVKNWSEALNYELGRRP